MRTFVDLSDSHPDYALAVSLLRECGFFIISIIDHPVSALYSARFVGTKTTFGWPEITTIFELNPIIIGHFGVEMCPIRCTNIPNHGVVRIDIKRRCIVCPQWLMKFQS